MGGLQNPDALGGQAVAIEARKLAKRFKGRSGTVEALRGVSFDVAREKVFCILGPNGAGKTTLLRILTTVMRPSSGKAIIEGFDIGRQNIEIRHRIGIVAQDNHFDRYLTCWQNLVLHAQMHGLEKNVYERRIRELLERVDLYDRRQDSLDDFSGGMQRRVALIRALIHEPAILFLDEPTTGLDPGARREIWHTIQELKQRTTVILTTHYMEEADRLSDRILIINHGQVVMEGTSQELKERMSPPNTYELCLNNPLALEYQQRLSPFIQESAVLDAAVLRFRLGSLEALPDLMARIRPEDLRSLGLAEADLETVYLSVAGAQAAEARVMTKPIYFRQGILPIAKKVLQQEAQGWVNEAINTAAIPLTFFLAFGLGLQHYIDDVDGVSYMAFLTPGLITMTILLEAYRTGAWGLWLDRWHQKMLDEFRIKPVHTTDIIMGEILGGFMVALIKGTVVAAILMFISPVDIRWSALPLYFLLVFPGCVLFTCVGSMVGTSFPKPDNIAQSQTIFVTPLLYLGGLFFPISSLPAWIQPIVHWLPTTAAFEGGRAILLRGTLQPHFLTVMILCAAASFALATWLFKEKLSE